MRRGVPPSVLHHRQLDRLAEHPFSRPLRARANRNAHLGDNVKRTWLASGRLDSAKTTAGAGFNVTSTSVRVGVEALAGGHMKRHAMPAPRVDEQMERGVGRDVRALADARLVAVPAELSEHCFRRR